VVALTLPCLAPRGARPPTLTHVRVTGAIVFCGEHMLISIVIGLAITTLIATGLLFVAQAYEDFRDV
jgi:hypothetical protein